MKMSLEKDVAGENRAGEEVVFGKFLVDRGGFVSMDKEIKDVHEG